MIREESSGSMKPKYVIIIIQAVLCLIFILGVIILKTADNSTFLKVKEWYKTNAQDNTDIDEVINGKTTSAGVTFRTAAKLVTVNVPEFALISPLDGIITSGYGYRTDPFTNEYTMHYGIDIAAEKNSEIVCCADGVVEKIDYEKNGYGNFVIIDHKNGIKTLYAHCEKIIVSENKQVQKGKTIALVGSTGRSTGNHLHLEVIKNGENINPDWVVGK